MQLDVRMLLKEKSWNDLQQECHFSINVIDWKMFLKGKSIAKKGKRKVWNFVNIRWSVEYACIWKCDQAQECLADVKFFYNGHFYWCFCYAMVAFNKNITIFVACPASAASKVVLLYLNAALITLQQRILGDMPIFWKLYHMLS